MDTLALRRLRVLPVPRGEGLSRKHKLGILTELSALGYAERVPDGHAEWIELELAMRHPARQFSDNQYYVK